VSLHVDAAADTLLLADGPVDNKSVKV
jgi:hypothetical protein